MIQPIEGETLNRDVFPAEVLMPNGEFARKVRVLVTSHRMLIFRWVGEIDAEEYDLVESVQKNKATLAIADRLELKLKDGTVFINRALGCRCGPLGHMRSPVNW